MPTSNLSKDQFSARRNIRREKRKARRELSQRERLQLSDELCRRVIVHPVFLRSKSIACYLPDMDGEADLEPIICRAWDTGKSVFLPVVRQPRMWFKPFKPNTNLVPDRFGIPTPNHNADSRANLFALDIIFTPLVAFDSSGNRMGRGGGFYDKTFAFKRFYSNIRRPLLLGVGFSFQQVNSLPSADWDVPIDGVVTECGITFFHNAITK